MKLKNLLIIKAAVYFLLGIAILASPDFVYSLFGSSLTAGGIFAVREYAASLFGNMLPAWIARDAEESTARKAILISLFAYNGIYYYLAVSADRTIKPGEVPF